MTEDGRWIEPIAYLNGEPIVWIDQAGRTYSYARRQPWPYLKESELESEPEVPDCPAVGEVGAAPARESPTSDR